MKAATKAEKYRMGVINQQCVACYQNGVYGQPGDIHHLLNGYRLGHSWTVALCPWHHRGQPPGGLTNEQATELAGPSLAHNKGEFHRVLRRGST